MAGDRRLAGSDRALLAYGRRLLGESDAAALPVGRGILAYGRRLRSAEPDTPQGSDALDAGASSRRPDERIDAAIDKTLTLRCSSSLCESFLAQRAAACARARSVRQHAAFTIFILYVTCAEGEVLASGPGRKLQGSQRGVLAYGRKLQGTDRQLLAYYGRKLQGTNRGLLAYYG